MIVTLSGITGIGKSFFKKVIANELGFKNMVIVTTREKRKNEINGVDKIFVKETEFNEIKKTGKILGDFDFLGNKYAYKSEDMQSYENKVTEVHYSKIGEFKNNANDDVFSIYLIPSDYEKAKIELHKRGLPEQVEKQRLKEIEEHIKEYSTNKELQAQFDYVFVNNYDEDSKNKLLEIIKKKIKVKGMVKV